jgi:HAE1 family hydrophobic/amphiphilic exporter-1
MTAFSSILGFMPLLLASGAGAASRIAVGLAVVGGMIAATCFSLLFVPSFFVVFQSLSEFRKEPDSPLASDEEEEPKAVTTPDDAKKPKAERLPNDDSEEEGHGK